MHRDALANGPACKSFAFPQLSNAALTRTVPGTQRSSTPLLDMRIRGVCDAWWSTRIGLVWGTSRPERAPDQCGTLARDCLARTLPKSAQASSLSVDGPALSHRIYNGQASRCVGRNDRNPSRAEQDHHPPVILPKSNHLGRVQLPHPLAFLPFCLFLLLCTCRERASVERTPEPARMPRDLRELADKNTLDDKAPLSNEPEPASSPPQDNPSPMPLYRMPTSFVEERFKKMKDLHPYALLLNQDDLNDCDWLEHVAFDPVEAASREKLEYRLKTCGELCTGLFSSAYPTNSGPLGSLVKTRKFPSVDSADSDRKRLLLGHIIATKSTTPLVTDSSMDFPPDWRTNYQLGPPVGHHEEGETICLHSLCIHPDFHGKGLGAVLLRGWTQRMKDAGLGKRIALICRDRLVAFYEKAGFKKQGPSQCQYGGGNWINMIFEFDQVAGDEDDI